MANDTLTRSEVYRGLQAIVTLAQMEASRVGREQMQREREAKKSMFDDDPTDMLFAAISGEGADHGLRILADDVATLQRRLDFANEEQLSDVRELASQFMIVAQQANDGIDNPNSPQAFAWQRTFKLLRRIATYCFPKNITAVAPSDDGAEDDDCSHLAAHALAAQFGGRKTPNSLRQRFAGTLPQSTKAPTAPTEPADSNTNTEATSRSKSKKHGKRKRDEKRGKGKRKKNR